MKIVVNDPFIQAIHFANGIFFIFRFHFLAVFLFLSVFSSIKLQIKFIPIIRCGYMTLFFSVLRILFDFERKKEKNSEKEPLNYALIPFIEITMMMMISTMINNQFKCYTFARSLSLSLFSFSRCPIWRDCFFAHKMSLRLWNRIITSSHNLWRSVAIEEKAIKSKIDILCDCITEIKKKMI